LSRVRVRSALIQWSGLSRRMRLTFRSPCPPGSRGWLSLSNLREPDKSTKVESLNTWLLKSASFQFTGSSIFHQMLPLLTS
jgi:hypothetical protein